MKIVSWKDAEGNAQSEEVTTKLQLRRLQEKLAKEGITDYDVDPKKNGHSVKTLAARGESVNRRAIKALSRAS